MKLIGIVRLGRDAEIRYSPSGEPIASFSGAFDYGRKGDNDRRPTQWVDFTLWGKRAEALGDYLTKGRQVFVVAGEPHIETFDKRDGATGFKLVARVDDLQLVGGRDEGGGAAPSPAPRPRADAPYAQQATKRGTGFDDMDDDVPF